MQNRTLMDPRLEDQRIRDILFPGDYILRESQIFLSVKSVRYSDEERRKIPCYNFQKGTLDPISLGNIARFFFQVLTSRSIPLKFPSIMLALALHLKSRATEGFIFADYWPQTPHKRFLFRRLVTTDDLNDDVQKYLVFPTQRNMVAHYLNLPDGSSSVEEEDPLEDENNFSSKQASFLAAYLFRMLSKTSENAFSGLRNMRKKYQSFYRGENFPHLSLTRGVLEKIRLLINNDLMVKVSWVETVANYETAALLDSDDAGMVRFLANLPLSYTGMRVYALLLQLKTHTERSFTWILEQLLTPEHRAPLIELRDILNDHERCIEYPDRPTHFKYARLYSSSFFLALQSKNCSSLLYLLTKILGHFLRAGEEGGMGDIMAISQVGGKHREFLDHFALNVYNQLQT